MSYRSKARSGTCIIAVASLLCGINAATLRLAAQPLLLPTDQPATGEPRASFDERFSSAIRAEPLFTRPEIQNLLASLPPSAATADVLVAGAGTEPSMTAPAQQEGLPAEPQPAENTASVTTQKPGSEAAAITPNLETQPPGLPPPPPPAEVVLPPAEEQAAAKTPSQSPSEMPGVGAPEAGSHEEAPEPSTSQQAEVRKPNLKRQAKEEGTRAKKKTAVQMAPFATGAIPNCRMGAVCISQQQSVAIFFGFVAGGLLGGPIGAIAGGVAGALLMASDPSHYGRSDTASRR